MIDHRDSIDTLPNVGQKVTLHTVHGNEVGLVQITAIDAKLVGNNVVGSIEYRYAQSTDDNVARHSGLIDISQLGAWFDRHGHWAG